MSASRLDQLNYALEVLSEIAEYGQEYTVNVGFACDTHRERRWRSTKEAQIAQRAIERLDAMEARFSQKHRSKQDKG